MSVLISPLFPWENNQRLRQIWPWFGCGGLITGLISTYVLGQNEQIWRARAIAKDEAAKTLISEKLALNIHQSESRLEQLTPSPLPESNMAILPAGDVAPKPNFYYQHDRLVSEGTGFLITGRPGSGKTSVACWLACSLTKDTPAQVIALDPHFNELWSILGVKLLGRSEAILETIAWLIEEIDRRYAIKEQNFNDGGKLPLGDPIIVFFDEVGEIMAKLPSKESSQLSQDLRVIATSGRKVNVTLILLNQSPNGGDLGISAKYLNAFLQIALCDVAHDLAIDFWGKDSPEFMAISSKAYPSLVCRSVPAQVMIHPTHGDYAVYQREEIHRTI
ncbi:MAG: AAA family ATPase [Synechococcaceae cyanobacterium RL_1_2]|nr:AAA family ATPase [Synechococcaceae cyanobacterium RL_1_2]